MIRWGGMEILETLDELIDPGHTALLLWDFDKSVVSNSFNYDAMIKNTATVLRAARERDVPVLYAQQNNMRIVGDTGAPTIRMRMKRQGGGMNRPEPKGTPPRPELVEQVKPRKGDIIFEKFLPNAFLGTCFEWWLKKYQIKTILLTGVNVATGINGTAREAINLGYYAVVVRDCVGTRSEEDYRIALAAMERVLDVYDSSEIVARWRLKPEKKNEN
jgi:nicotinamidase-related amidase